MSVMKDTSSGGAGFERVSAGDDPVNPMAHPTPGQQVGMSFMDIDGPVYNQQMQSEPDLELESEAKNAACLLESHVTHAYIALYITPAWFFANLLYNCSLLETSVTSSTILR